MPPRPESVVDGPDLERLAGGTVPVAIRDLSDRTVPAGVWLPAINVATGGPQSHVIYHDLVKHAQMRLMRTTDGTAMVTVAEAGAVHVLKVPSPEFSRFVDRFRVARRLRVLPEPALSELARIIEARVGDPAFKDDLPAGASVEPLREPGSFPAPEKGRKPVETDLMAYALNRVVFQSPYVFVPSALAAALGESERHITSMFIEHRDRLRELGFDSRPVLSTLGPVFLVTRVTPPSLASGQEPEK
jgi:hypothetical protein